ncbi:DUF455-domain-containing protein [Gymnopus androsaceus JB14]|uniref:DUF455-domain-containing protein n=1 Tax=Gymnopus androsaceus JB14 TaxID=1447944 RepID=A0A6A4H410_9AGAR|nr:DUF455-domain-containing protein [Gymnopus androsaceus JB14]
MEWAVLILNTPNPTLKVDRTRYAVHAFRTGTIASIGNKVAHPPVPPAQPPRETDMNIIEPGKIQSGKRKNRAVMLHALANIEQIDLAWNIIARFGPMHKDLPVAFFSDFSKVALDEGKHCSLLRARLDSLSTPYSSLPVHASLWESASHTSASPLFRLAIIFASVGSGRTFSGAILLGSMASRSGIRATFSSVNHSRGSGRYHAHSRVDLF